MNLIELLGILARMPRPPRVQFPEASYHVMSRGNAQQKIFLDDRDRLVFLDILREVVSRFSWVCMAYCLLETHYHLLIKTPEPTLSQGMHILNSTYSHYFNKEHDLRGHLLESRYLSPLIESTRHRNDVARYMALNPVRAGLASRPEHWRWSSYPATIGLVNRPDFLNVREFLAVFSPRRKESARQFASFVESGLVASTQPTTTRRPTLRELFRDARGIKKRNKAIVAAITEGGYSVNEIAAYLRLSRSTVSRALND